MSRYLCGMKFVTRLAIVWAVVLTALILFAQQPGGFSHSLDWENLWGGWGMLYFKLVFVPWLLLVLIAGVFTAARGR